MDLSNLTTIRCTLADLQLVQTVLIDVTVSVSRDYGILTTGTYDRVAMDSANQFGYAVQELKNIAMQLKQNTGWVTTVKETAPVSRKRRRSSQTKQQVRQKRRSSVSNSEPQEEGENSQPETSDFALDTTTQDDISEETDRGTTIPGVSVEINQSPNEEERVDSPLLRQGDIVIKKEAPDSDYTSEEEYEDVSLDVVKYEQRLPERWPNIDNQENINDNNYNVVVPRSHLTPHCQSFLDRVPSANPGTSHTVTQSDLLNPDNSYNPQITTSTNDSTPSEISDLHDVSPLLEESKSIVLQQAITPSEIRRQPYRQSRGKPLMSEIDLKLPGREFFCKMCKKSFTYKSQFDRHQKSHSDVKPYCCLICDKTFAFEHNYLGHCRTHTGEKPFKCTYCDKMFTERSTLNIHRRIHTGEKPHKCDRCGKCFKQKVHLQNHFATHTEEKPFECNLCKTRFKYIRGLWKHKKFSRCPPTI